MAGAVAPPLRFRLRCEKLADGIEGLDICDGIRPRCATDRRLVDQDDVVQPVGSANFLVGADRVAALALTKLMRDCFEQHIMHQRRLA